jgi:hypothetical protein
MVDPVPPHGSAKSGAEDVVELADRAHMQRPTGVPGPVCGGQWSRHRNSSAHRCSSFSGVTARNDSWPVKGAEAFGRHQRIRPTRVLARVQHPQMPVQQIIHRRMRMQTPTTTHLTKQTATGLLSLLPRQRSVRHGLPDIARSVGEGVWAGVDRTRSDPLGNRVTDPCAHGGAGRAPVRFSRSVALSPSPAL